jgi:hypothetical protein
LCLDTGFYILTIETLSIFFPQFIEANKDKKVQPKSREPVRSKSHWDFVLEEMAWLAKVSNFTQNQET